MSRSNRKGKNKQRQENSRKLSDPGSVAQKSRPGPGGIVAGQVGSQLLTTFFLFDDAINNPDWQHIPDYETMIHTDETVAAGLDFFYMAVLNKLDRYENKENPEIEEFVNKALEAMQGNLIFYCRDILTAIPYGFSATEIIWKWGKLPKFGNDVYLLPDYLATYHPKTVYFNVDRMTGRLEAVTQWRWYVGSPVQMPLNKCIVYSHKPDFGNPYGTSQLKAARKNWILKDPTLKMWANALDKYGAPLIAALVADPDSDVEWPAGSGQFITNLQLAAELLANVHNGSGIALGAANGDGVEKKQPTSVQSLTGGGQGMSEAFLNKVTYLNKMILRALLVPSLIMDEGQKSGSYALGMSHFSIFEMLLNETYKKLSEVLVEQFVRRIVEYNFGPQDDYGSFPAREFDDTERTAMANIVTALTSAGYLSPEEQEDMDTVREYFNYTKRKVKPPDKSDADITTEYAHMIEPPDGGALPKNPPGSAPNTGAEGVA